MSEWAVHLPGKKWFGVVPVEVIPLVLRDEGEIAPCGFLVESLGVWEEVATEAEVSKVVKGAVSPGREYRVWRRLLRVGSSVLVYKLVRRARIERSADLVFNLLEFLEVLGESLGLEKAEKETPLDPVEFQKYVVRLLRSWVPDIQTVSEAYSEEYIKAIESEDWSKKTEAEIEDEFSRLAKFVPLEVLKVTPRMVQTGAVMAYDLSLATREGTIEAGGLELETGFNIKDSKSIERMAQWSFKQIPVSYVKMSDRLSKTMQRELLKTLETGERYQTAVKEVIRQTPEIVTRQQVHFLNVTASSALSRARTQSQLMTYRDAEVEVLYFRAVMDERTTPQCFWANDQIISVTPILNYAEKAVTANEDPRNAFPWVTNRKDRATGEEWLEYTQDGKTHRFADKDPSGVFKYREGWNMARLNVAGVGTPPLHALCRSTVLARIERM